MLGNNSKSGAATLAFFYIPEITRDSGIFVSDKDGYIFSEFFKILAEEKGTELPPSVLDHPDHAANDYVRNYNMVIVMKDASNAKICYSVDYVNKLPREFIDRIRNYLHLMPDDTVLWSDDVFKDPSEVSAREVIYGKKLERPSRETRADIRKKWAHPQALNQREMDYLTGKSDEPPIA